MSVQTGPWGNEMRANIDAAPKVIHRLWHQAIPGVLRTVLCLGCLVCTALFPSDLRAASPQDLIRQGDLPINTSVIAGGSVVPGQKIGLRIELATTRWFTGGTRIEIPEVPGLVILQTEQFASNASEVRAGQTWVIQRWTLDVFPQQAQAFTVGPIPVQVSVNAGGSDSAKGQVFAPAVNFTAAIPDVLSDGVADGETWVASPTFAVEQSFDRNLDGLSVGDAVERTVRFEANDVLAMMLPALNDQGAAGVTAYPSPPVLDNRNNRGTQTARRTEVISYVVQVAGTWTLPAQRFHWWDTQSQALKAVELGAITFTVVASEGETSDGQSAFIPSPKTLLLTLLALIVAGISVFLLRKLPKPPYPWFRAAWDRLHRALSVALNPVLPDTINPRMPPTESKTRKR